MDKALESLRNALDRGLTPAALAKAFISPTSATAGLAEYNLEAPAQLIYPVTTILRNMTPRVKATGGIQANWRSIVAINPNGTQIGLSEGNRGGLNNYTEVDTFAKFCELGMDDYVTWKAERAAEGFMQIDELAQQMLLQSTMEAEEKVMLYDFGTSGIGTTPNPVTSTTTTGGTIPSQSGLLTCVALTARGVAYSSVSGGVQIPYTRTNADGTTDTINGFSGKPSANQAATTSTATSTVTGTVTPVPGAAGYAWFYGTSGNQLLAAITSINSVVLIAPPTGTQNLTALPSTDTSVDSLVFDGLIAQIVNSATNWGAGFGAYIQALGTGTAGTGSSLTSTGSGSGGIVEFDNAIMSFYNNHRLVPDTIFINGHDQQKIKALILNGNTNLAPFFMNAQDGTVKAGFRVNSYRSPIGFGNPDLDLITHPFLPQGTVIFFTKKIPYALSNVGQLYRMLLRRDYYSILWPLRSRKYEYGTYFDGVFQHKFPASMGMIYNIAP